MANVSGIAIVIKAFLPTGKTLDEQFAALSIVKAAHETGDYAALLAAAQIDEVKTEQKVRRIEDAPAVPLASGPSGGSVETSSSSGGPVDNQQSADPVNGTAHIKPGQPDNFADGLDEPRVNPEDDDPFNSDPLDQPVAEPKRRARA